jgi:hypothetical protein
MTMTWNTNGTPRRTASLITATCAACALAVAAPSWGDGALQDALAQGSSQGTGKSSQGTGSKSTKSSKSSRSSKSKSGSAKSGSSDAAADAGSADAERPKTQVFVLPLEGMVGVGLRNEEMEKLEKIADKFGPGQIFIIRINSNGGLVIEGDEINVTLSRIKQKHRLIAWIEKAISGGAFTGMHADEIYFTPEGSLGSITMMSGSTEVTAARDPWKERVAEVAVLGGRDPQIGRAMVYSEEELSYDKDEKTGKVTFYPNLKGKYILSKKGENLTLNATNALHSGFSDGTAATEEELFKLLDLDNPERFAPNDAGHKIYKDYQTLIKRAQREVPLLTRKLEIEGTGSGDPKVILQSRIKNAQDLIRWIDRAQDVLQYELNIPPQAKEELEKRIVEWRRELARLNTQNQGGT